MALGYSLGLPVGAGNPSAEHSKLAVDPSSMFTFSWKEAIVTRKPLLYILD